MERLHKHLTWAIIVAETSHVFCCVLPTIFSVLSLMAGLGLVAAVPTPLMSLHELMHDWEIPIIIASGVVIALGWGLHVISSKLDCRSTGCAHEPCGPKKKRAGTVLKIATILFIINAFIYVSFHRTTEAGTAFYNGNPDTHMYHHDH